MQEAKTNSSAKASIICALFCLLAGIGYGILESTGCPINSFGKGLLVFGSTLGWFGTGFSILLLLKKRFKQALIILIATNAIAMGLGYLAMQRFFSPSCALQIRAVDIGR
mgnify:CR=1 FL=1